jgi:RNA polymerase sigma factor (sigma-70 family)
MSLDPTDSALVTAAGQGDKRAFAELAERHYPALLGACRHMLGDAELARDAAQEATLRALLGLGGLRDRERFGPWLIGIGLNVCRSLIGARSRQAASLETWLEDRLTPEPAAPNADPAEQAPARELAARVRAAIASLPAGQRQAVALFYLAGLTHAEIADEIGTRPGAVKTRLHKARCTLRQTLHDLTPEMPNMPDFITMHVTDLRRTAAGDRHIVFLQSSDGTERIPIWIGAPEAMALAIMLDGVELPRPGSHHFAASLLAASGGELREVRITALTESVFYAAAVLADGTTVDARPSDALALALVTGVPINVSRSVLEQTAAGRDRILDLLEEAEAAPDDARALADEVRARLAATAEELALRNRT